MEARLLGAALWRRRGTALLAVLAIAIGVSVASALLHVSRDIEWQLRHELKALGPNLLVLPADSGAFLDVGRARATLAAEGLPAAPELLVVARGDAGPIEVIGVDLAASRALHPQWKIADSPAPTRIGARLRAKLGLAANDTLRVRVDDRALALPAGPVLAAGGPEDDAWLVPLAVAQELAALPGRASVVQSRLAGDAEAADAVAARIARGSGARAVPVRSLSSTESLLLDRMRRLMALVTAAALAAAGLCAFGTLTDRTLERRREIALLRALGAGRRDVIRLLGAEAAAIGVLGGLAGWGIGVLFAEVIGRQVFHSVITLRWDVVPVVLVMAVAVAGLASIGPIRGALATDPAAALKGD